MSPEEFSHAIAEGISLQNQGIDNLGDNESIVLMGTLPTINLVQLAEHLIKFLAPKEQTVMIPSTHLNGTSKTELIQQNIDAYEHILESIQLLQKACPNGRDFYPQGPQAINAAIEGHRSRVRRLEEVRAELETILLALTL